MKRSLDNIIPFPTRESPEEKFSRILKKAVESEVDDPFYKDLTYSEVDEHYLENLLAKAEKKQGVKKPQPEK